MLNVDEIDAFSIERDPGKRLPMWDYPVNRRDEIRIAYLKAHPYRSTFSSRLSTF
jgi:hypothetical protein